MIFLEKKPEKDFVILNLTDPQMSLAEWGEDQLHYKVLTHTLEELLARVQPDLITVSGDISWGYEVEAYKKFADLMEKTGIPWAPVWGNHDNEGKKLEEISDLYLTYPNCKFEKGDPGLGNGNYLLVITEEGKPVEALFMVDTHDYNPIVTLDRFCVEQKTFSYASLTDEQMAFYAESVETLKEMGCYDSTMVMHTPFYGYRTAFLAVTEDEFRPQGSVSLADSYEGVGWKEGYKETAFGVNREGIASSEYDDAVLPLLLEKGHTHNVIAGHDHVNNFSILFEGIRLTYGLKIGPGCYWNEDLNGGTVLKVDKCGVKELYHEYVDITHLLG